MTIADATIFIVDDDSSVRKSLTRLIRAAGWGVESFSSGSAFLARLPFSGRGCVILDLAMPGVAGMELRDRMAAQNISLPIIFLSGDDKAMSGMKSANVPATDSVAFLTKPVDAGTLIAAVRLALERRDAGNG